MRILAQKFSGIDGFLPSRGSIMLDIVFLAMFVIVPVMLWSIYLVKYQQRYALHKRVQLLLGLLLLVAVTLFELDMQFITNWEERAGPSPYFDLARKWQCTVGVSLLVHLCFAVPTAVLWVYVIVQGLRKFPHPVAPNDYSPTHMFWAKLAALGMTGTAVTGWVFYWLAFVSAPS